MNSLYIAIIIHKHIEISVIPLLLQLLDTIWLVFSKGY